MNKTRGSDFSEYMPQLKCHTAPSTNVFNPITYNSTQEHVNFKNDSVIVSKKWEYRCILVIEHAAWALKFRKNFARSALTKIEAFIDSERVTEKVCHCLHLSLCVKLFHLIWHVCVRIFVANDKDVLNRDDEIFLDRGPQEGRKILSSRPLWQKGRT